MIKYSHLSGCSMGGFTPVAVSHHLFAARAFMATVALSMSRSPLVSTKYILSLVLIKKSTSYSLRMPCSSRYGIFSVCLLSSFAKAKTSVDGSIMSVMKSLSNPPPTAE